jgi:hypothetical protein
MKTTIERRERVNFRRDRLAFAESISEADEQDSAKGFAPFKSAQKQAQ